VGVGEGVMRFCGATRIWLAAMLDSDYKPEELTFQRCINRTSRSCGKDICTYFAVASSRFDVRALVECVECLVLHNSNMQQRG
jgi:hypothetical protein